jgi:hypothetical protein
MSETSTQPMAWANVLDEIEQSLRRSLERTPQPAPSEATSALASNPLERLDRQLVTWQTGLDRAEQLARVADTSLEAEENALTGWLERMDQLRQSLQAWQAR